MKKFFKKITIKRILVYFFYMVGTIIIGKQNPFILIGIGFLLLAVFLELEKILSLIGKNLDDIWAYSNISEELKDTSKDNVQEKTLTVMSSFKDLGDSYKKIGDSLYPGNEGSKND